MRNIHLKFVKTVGLDKDEPTHFEWWFKGAFNTFARTAKPKSIAVKKRLEVVSGRYFKRLGTSIDLEYEKVQKNVIEKIAKEGRLHIGQAQKLINILAKYHYAYLMSGLPHSWNHTRKEILKHSSVLHVPIDKIVIGTIFEKYRTLLPPNNPIGYKRGHIEFKGKKYSWSRIDSYDLYLGIQENIREMARKLKMKPIDFETKCLWR